MSVTVESGSGSHLGSGGSGSDGGAWTPRDAWHDSVRVLEVFAGVALVAVAVSAPFVLLGLGGWMAGAALRRRRREQTPEGSIATGSVRPDPRLRYERMFVDGKGSDRFATPPPGCDPPAPSPLNLPALEREITELSAHIQAATCRWLDLVAEFDRRDGWAASGCRSCAHWLSWRCGLSPGAAREQVRVARRLEELSRIREVFARGELSFSQVRAVSRIATPDTEGELLNLAQCSTAAQLERLVRAYRGVLARELEAVRRSHDGRYVVWSHDDDGSYLLHARLPAEDGEVVLAALQAGREALRSEARDDVSAETRDPLASAGVSAETPSKPARGLPPRATSADALVLMAETLISNGPSPRRASDRHEVMVHVDVSTLAAREDDGGRCELRRGSALHPETARRLACDASLVRVIERDGRPLSAGRRSRSVPPALRRALNSRDGGCRFPGCEERRYVDAHHIRHWAHGGRTDLENLVLLCRHHHRLLHEGGYSVEVRPGGRLVFRRPTGQLIPNVPHRLRGHAREIPHRNRRTGLSIDHTTPVPDWFGDPLDLHAAVGGLADRDSRFMPERAPPA